MANVGNLSQSDVDAMASNRKGLKYPNPFFDLARNYIPDDLKKLFKYCRDFYYTDTFLSSVINKLTQYPITDLIVDARSEKTRKEYERILYEHVDVKRLLIEMGLDYYVSGNSFISIMMVPKRFLVPPKGSNKEALPIEQVNYKYKNHKFMVPVGQGRHEEEEWTIKDEEVTSIKNFRITRWNPVNIEIKHNSITGDSTYYYSIPNSIKNDIRLGKKHILKNIPKIFLDAVKHNKSVEIDNDKFFHFKRPTLAESDMGWGKPIIMPAMKKIYYLQTLQRGNEAIAHEHIVPKKAVSPAQGGAIDPFSQLNLGKWRSRIKDEVKKWRQDPNHMAVFPIPMQYQELGGNARSLLLTQEMAFLEENIINSLGVPLEFIKGGASWTGSSVSLRIIENLFLPYRSALERFLNQFLVPKLATIFDLEPVKVKLKNLKMTDDAQMKQLTVNLNEAGKISDHTLVQEFGYNVEEELAHQKTERTTTRTQAKDDQLAQAQAQGESQVVLAKYQARAQKAAEWEAMRYSIEKMGDQLSEELGGLSEDPVILVERFALEIMSAQEEQAFAKLRQLSVKSPALYKLVMERIQMFQQGGLPLDGDALHVQKSSPNQQSPGSRKKDQVNVRDKEKTKGNTRGTPQA